MELKVISLANENACCLPTPSKFINYGVGEKIIFLSIYFPNSLAPKAWKFNKLMVIIGSIQPYCNSHRLTMLTYCLYWQQFEVRSDSACEKSGWGKFLFLKLSQVSVINRWPRGMQFVSEWYFVSTSTCTYLRDMVYLYLTLCSVAALSLFSMNKW